MQLSLLPLAQAGEDFRALNDRLSCDCLSGTITWRNGRLAGKRAGSFGSRGYRRVRVDGVEYAEHRLVWLLTYGQWPAGALDHIDGDPGNNSILNLRTCNASQNGANRGPQRNNTTGYKGVVLHRQTGRWQAQIKTAGRYRYLGLFDTPGAAHFAYAHAARHAFGTFARVA